ncbi:transglutaminase-like domain-containing protein [Clostridium sp. 'White wine YQ']|uniref:transglutaminase-like domain-containing protein n=1 Tax=Clostridium sp. 'White wine YQ' TaxID=3027474 RepID=UPI0023655BD5|nr:transglutaminase-like domain-containing protein [Clostridium sp. 'White wine YQ']MDD7792818.1 transglutaminase-like domain-containing protein [Clostridium sp. 'White wine YQ']
MKWIRHHRLNLFLITLNVVYILFLLKKAYRVENIDYGNIVGTIVISILLTWTILGEEVSDKITIPMSIAIFGCLFFIFFISRGANNSIEIINSNLSSGKSTDFKEYRYFIITIVPFIYMWGAYLSKIGSLGILTYLDISIVTILWFLGYKEEIIYTMPFLLATILLTFGANNLKHFLIKESLDFEECKITKWKLVLFSIGLTAILIGISTKLPYRKAGAYSTKIKANLSINKTKYNDVSDESFIGYNEGRAGFSQAQDKLGGKLKLNDKEAFKITFLQGEINKQYYFRGNVRDTYIGDRWVSNHQQIVSDDAETSSDNLVSEIKGLGGKVIEVKISPDIKNESYYAPKYSTDIQEENNQRIYKDVFSNIFFSKDLINTPYIVKFLDDDFLEQSIVDNKLLKIATDGKVSSEVPDFYLQIPNSVTLRTFDLVREITKDKVSPKDKVEAIKKYLESNYKYSLDVSEIPQGQDFLDYFLFTEKKGYCEYFATAMTMMCRISGVPARYVEGFKLSDKRDNDGNYIVTNMDAHAWCEVNYKLDEDSSKIKQDNIWLEADASPTAYEFSEKDSISNFAANSSSNVNAAGKVERTKSQKSEDSNSVNIANSNKFKIENDKLFKIVGILLIFMIVLRILQIKRKYKYLRKETSAKKIFLYYEKGLSSIDILKKNYETYGEFIDRIEDVTLSNNLKKLIQLVYLERYGNEVKLVNGEEYVDYFEDYLKKKDGNMIYLIKKFFSLRKG